MSKTPMVIELDKRHVLGLSLILMAFTAAPILNIRDPVTNMFSEAHIHQDLRIGAGEGTLNITEDDETTSFIPDENTDKRFYYNVSEGQWVTEEIKMQSFESSKVVIGGDDTTTEQNVEENIFKVQQKDDHHSSDYNDDASGDVKVFDLKDAQLVSGHIRVSKDGYAEEAETAGTELKVDYNDGTTETYRVSLRHRQDYSESNLDMFSFKQSKKVDRIKFRYTNNLYWDDTTTKAEHTWKIAYLENQ